MKYILLLLCILPLGVRAEDDTSPQTLKLIFCQKSIDCGEKMFSNPDECVAKMPDLLPATADPKKYGARIKSCAKAIQKNSCESLQKAAPDECKFLDEFD